MNRLRKSLQTRPAHRSRKNLHRHKIPKIRAKNPSQPFSIRVKAKEVHSKGLKITPFDEDQSRDESRKEEAWEGEKAEYLEY